MEISVWLTNREVQCLNFTGKQRLSLEKKVGDAKVILHADSDAFKASLPGADIALVWVFKEEWLALAPRLRWIATPAAGKENIRAAQSARLKITYGAFHGIIMAETAVGMILSAARGILKTRELQTQSDWPRTELEPSMAMLAGSHIVMLGFGAIGSRVARLLKPFGVRITGIKRSPIAAPDYFCRGDAKVILHADSAAFKASLPGADIALVWVFKKEWLALAPRLRWIATPAAGKENIRAAQSARLKITYGAFHGIIMAETAVGMILSAARGILKTRELQTQSDWPRTELEPSMAMLAGSHIVMLGFGAIGSRVARLLKPFGVRITGIKRSPIAAPDYFGRGDAIVTIDRLDSVLPETDHLVVILPNERATDDILDRRRLELLPGRAFVYNLGRGNAIDENALAEALVNRRIAGAYLDVFKEEPLPPDSPLRRCPNILLMPHSSAMAPNYMDLFIEEFADRYKEWKRTYRPRFSDQPFP